MPADLHRLPIPPHSVEAEQALLGGLLLDPKAWARIASQVGPADFYRNDHRIIFDAIAKLHDKRRAIDAVTVSEYLERSGSLGDTGGLAYIARLANDTPSASNIEAYAAAVRERSSLRRLKGIAEGIVGSASDVGERTAADLIADAQRSLFELQTRSRSGTGLIAARQLISELIDDLDRRSEGTIGLQLGLPDFDELTCGLEGGDLVVIAARPGMGKTALLVSVASTVSKSTGVAVFSAEMPAQQLMRRCVSLQAEIPQGLLRRAERLKDEHWPKISDAAGEISRKQLWVDDTPTPMLTHIRAETVALKARASLGLVMVDYVQLVRGIGANRYEQLRDVAYGLKALAKELNVPIVLLAQLNRDVEKRDHKRPSISDLRDSGSIEEAADIVGLLYSESYYDDTFIMPYVLECHIAKNRNGERGDCLWRFDGAYSRVRPLEDGPMWEYRKLIAKPKKRASDDL